MDRIHCDYISLHCANEYIIHNNTFTYFIAAVIYFLFVLNLGLPFATQGHPHKLNPDLIILYNIPSEMLFNCYGSPLNFVH